MIQAEAERERSESPASPSNAVVRLSTPHKYQCVPSLLGWLSPLSQPYISEDGGKVKTKTIEYKTKKGEIRKGAYCNEDHRGYWILPEGKAQKKHIKFSQVVNIKEE